MNNPNEDISAFIRASPYEPESLELVGRFIHGMEVKMTSDNIVPLICLAHYLQMTETHSPNNLLNNAILFLERKILPSWNQSIRSLQAISGATYKQAAENGLLDIMVESMTAHAVSNPSLVDEPMMDDDEWDDETSSSSSRDYSCTSKEDLSTLPVKVYEAMIKGMVKGKVGEEKIVGSLYGYYKRHGSERESIEAIERLIPKGESVKAYRLLLEMYVKAVKEKASGECVASLGKRIGKQLERARLEDLVGLRLGVESLRQVLMGYYGDIKEKNGRGLVLVAELMEEYLVEVAKGKETGASSFAEMAEMCSYTSSIGSNRVLDGIYRAVDTYLENHTDLSESEKEQVCKVLDFQKMSSQACQHAAMNQKLPLRVLVHVLFVSQLEIRDNIRKSIGESCRIQEERANEREVQVHDQGDDDDHDDDKEELIGCHHKKSKKKVGLWAGMKRKLGCMGSSSSHEYETLHDCNCCQHTLNNKNKKNKKNHHLN